MWLYMIAVVLLVAGIGGAVLTGGIFTIIVLPLGVIVLVAAIVVGMGARGSGAGSVENASEFEPAPLPHTNRPQPGSSGTTSPDELVDARRRAQ
jgi:uncharacterized membrane protein